MRRELIAHWEVWTPWFAWRPVRAGNALVWLEWVERKRSHDYDAVWDYRAMLAATGEIDALEPKVRP